ncbi:MAG: hypothetical protein JOZ08_18700 [Verrucomicrobia bacterium]|nr:hypothetical protein [Verrucomicrobiota bacterium]
MFDVLVKLSKENPSGSVQPEKVWEALKAVVQPKDDNEEEEEDEDVQDGSFFASPDEESSNEVDSDEDESLGQELESGLGLESESESEEVVHGGWEKGVWDEKDEFEIAVEVPVEFIRQMPVDAYTNKLNALKTSLNKHKLVGVHATNIENIGSLMKEGVSTKRFGSNHGTGKGPGFYTIATPNGIKSLDTAENRAKMWGSSMVAVYLPVECTCVEANEGENVATLEEEYKGKQCYYQFGKQEAVIPESLFKKIKLVLDPAHIAMADPSLPAIPAERSALAFLKELQMKK